MVMLRKNTQYQIVSDNPKSAKSLAESIRRCDSVNNKEYFDLPDAVIPRGCQIIERADFMDVGVDILKAENQQKRFKERVEEEIFFK